METKTYPPLLSATFVLVGYEPPAGDPGVEDGESSFRHDVDGNVPAATLYVTLPPAPRPLLSPAPNIRIVPPRTDGVHEKPRPRFGISDSVPWGIRND
jgi:hypothetical protein